MGVRRCDQHRRRYTRHTRVGECQVPCRLLVTLRSNIERDPLSRLQTPRGRGWLAGDAGAGNFALLHACRCVSHPFSAGLDLVRYWKLRPSACLSRFQPVGTLSSHFLPTWRRDGLPRILTCQLRQVCRRSKTEVVSTTSGRHKASAGHSCGLTTRTACQTSEHDGDGKCCVEPRAKQLAT